MHDLESHVGTLPTGRWLSQERQRLGKTLADVATALHRHSSTVRSIERNDRVIPPGWGDCLRKLGLSPPEPTWPKDMRSYFGGDLERDMQTRAGLQHSPFWLSKQLCVTGDAVVAVLRGNLLVPHNWLLKLAELGANVPAQVRMALYRSAEGSSPQAHAVPSWNLGLHELPFDEEDEPEDEPTAAGKKDHKRSPAAPVEPPSDASVRSERSSLYFHWTEDGGLHLSVSAPLLEQIPSGFKSLLMFFLQKSGLAAPKTVKGTSREGA